LLTCRLCTRTSSTFRSYFHPLCKLS